MAITKHTSYFELWDALGLPGCAICRVGEKAVSQFFDSLIYENVNDPGIRQDFREARGFCNVHAWQLVQAGGTSGIAILYRTVLKVVMEDLETIPFRHQHDLPLRWLQHALSAGASEGADELVAQLSPQAPCLACRLRDEKAALNIDVLLEHMQEEDFAGVYRASSGLCLRHLRETLQKVADEPTYRILTEAQLHIWRDLKHELDELIRKYDYRFADEHVGQEADAWLRAVGVMASEKGYGCE